MPGITDLTVASKTNFGALRQIEVGIKAWSIEQLSMLEKLYFRPGFTMFVEFGHAGYIDAKGSITAKNEALYLNFIKGKKLSLIKSEITKRREKDLKKTRNSNVTFLDKNWIFKTVNEFVSKANHNAGWNFEYDFTESCQFTIYKKTQHYTWHADAFPVPYSDNHQFKGFRGKIRKLSCIIQLSDPSEYEGGELEFDFRNSTKENTSNIVSDKSFRTKGYIIVFPSFVYHRVKPVTKGNRHSLVSWCLGKPYV